MTTDDKRAQSDYEFGRGMNSQPMYDYEKERAVRQTEAMAHERGLDAEQEALRKKALDELVDLIMRGEEFPRGVHRGQQINRLDILCECDQSELAQIMEWVLRSGLNYVDLIEPKIKEIVRAYLENTHWYDAMIQQLAEAERDAAAESALDSKRSNRDCFYKTRTRVDSRVENLR